MATPSARSSKTFLDRTHTRESMYSWMQKLHVKNLTDVESSDSHKKNEKAQKTKKKANFPVRGGFLSPVSHRAGHGAARRLKRNPKTRSTSPWPPADAHLLETLSADALYFRWPLKRCCGGAIDVSIEVLRCIECPLPKWLRVCRCDSRGAVCIHTSAVTSISRGRDENHCLFELLL